MPSPLAAPFLASLVAALLYAVGSRRHLRVASPARRRALRWRMVAFWTALAALVAALDSAIDDQAAKLFWVHMAQHVLLIMVAAPLLVLAAPWTPIWRGLPLGVRRDLAATVVRRRRLLAAIGAVAAPLPVWIMFNLDLCMWHVPALYGVTLRSEPVHDLEHLSFLILAVLFWAQVIESPPLRPRMEQPQRVAYVLGGAAVCWLLALVLTFAPSALYAGYGALASRPGGLSALGDQQVAAGVMLGPGSIPYGVFVFMALYRWLGSQPEAASRGRGVRAHRS